MGTGWEEPGRGGGECRPSSISLRCMLSSHSYKDLTVKMGNTFLYSDCLSAVVVPVQDIIWHRDFNASLITNDIALLQLANSVNYSSYIQPVCLPEKKLDVKAETQCWATGWGRTLEFGETGRQDLRGAAWCRGVGLQAEGRDREADSLTGGQGGRWRGCCLGVIEVQ